MATFKRKSPFWANFWFKKQNKTHAIDRKTLNETCLSIFTAGFIWPLLAVWYSAGFLGTKMIYNYINFSGKCFDVLLLNNLADCIEVCPISASVQKHCVSCDLVTVQSVFWGLWSSWSPQNVLVSCVNVVDNRGVQVQRLSVWETGALSTNTRRERLWGSLTAEPPNRCLQIITSQFSALTHCS